MDSLTSLNQHTSYSRTLELEKDLLHCSVCFEKYDLRIRAPKTLSCLHTFCQSCLQNIADVDSYPKCPSCRREFPNGTRVEDFPVDHRVGQIMEYLSQKFKDVQNGCLKHENEHLNFFCKKCRTAVCRDCTVLEHKGGHEIVSISTALSEHSKQFDDTEEATNQTLDALATKTRKYDAELETMAETEENLLEEIQSKFRDYRAYLDERESSLIRDMRKHVEEQKVILNAHRDFTATKSTQLREDLDKSRKFRESLLVRHVFASFKDLKDVEECFVEVAKPDGDEIFKRFTFRAANEEDFLCNITELGVIITEE
ncbi:unnamed protein product [Lymnaea stagnalis]|uniref:Uncharacterized protein n=1 Tax=Lymnaea stagnalis TaxID=6523 RepID=A0AAV2IEE5_LYMST